MLGGDRELCLESGRGEVALWVLVGIKDKLSFPLPNQ